MVIFTKKFGTLDPHLPIVWDKVPKKTIFFGTLPRKMLHLIQKLSSNLIVPHEVVSELFLFTLLIQKNKMDNLRDHVEMYS